MAQEGAVESGNLAVVPNEGRAAGEDDSGGVEDGVSEGDGSVWELVVSGPENGPDAVPASVTESSKGVEVWLHTDVILKEVWVSSKSENAVYLKHEYGSKDVNMLK